MSPPSRASYLLARLAGVQVALPVSNVAELLRTVALADIPGAPPIIEGALNVRGVLMPVFDLRSHLGLPARENTPSDSLVVLTVRSRAVAVRVESVEAVEEIDASEIREPAEISSALSRVVALSGVATREDGAVVIYDPDAFLSQAEQEAIDVLLVRPA